MERDCVPFGFKDEDAAVFIRNGGEVSTGVQHRRLVDLLLPDFVVMPVTDEVGDATASHGVDFLESFAVEECERGAVAVQEPESAVTRPRWLQLLPASSPSLLPRTR